MKIYLNKNVALGNGTRPKGFLLGESTAATVAEITQENTALAEGVNQVEWINAMANPDLLTHVAPLAAVPAVVDAVYTPPQPTAPPMPSEPSFDPASEDPFADIDPDKGSEPSESNESESEVVIPESVRSQPVAALKPPKGVAKILADAGIKTVGELQDYADSHAGLSELGVTSEQEKEILAAFDKLLQ